VKIRDELANKGPRGVALDAHRRHLGFLLFSLIPLNFFSSIYKIATSLSGDEKCSNLKSKMALNC
jgi:hypothetical protein